MSHTFQVKKIFQKLFQVSQRDRSSCTWDAPSNKEFEYSRAGTHKVSTTQRWYVIPAED